MVERPAHAKVSSSMLSFFNNLLQTKICSMLSQTSFPLCQCYFEASILLRLVSNLPKMGVIWNTKHSTPLVFWIVHAFQEWFHHPLDVPIKDDNWINSATTVNEAQLVHICEYQGKLFCCNAAVFC
jgi:hypothetical protein